MYELRDHQLEAVEALRASLKSGHKRPLLQAPTAFGKTAVAVAIIRAAREKGKKVLFVAPRITIVDQTSRVFDDNGIAHGIRQADHWRYNHEPVQIASIQTLIRRQKKPDADLVIWDEAHKVWKGMVDLLDSWDRVPVVGLSATPFTKGLGKIFDDLVLVETTASLIEKGYLSPYTAYGPSGPDLQGVRTSAGDYNQRDLEKRTNKTKLIGDIVSNWLRIGQNRKTVCFAVSVAHSKAIAEEFLANGINAEHMDAYTDLEERDEILARHDSGVTQVLCNVGILNEGWDSPDTSCLILARPTKSQSLYIQMVGRVLRTADGKRDAIILDHGSNIERLGFPDDQQQDFLCNGDKSETKERKEREEPLPKPCPACTHLHTGIECPVCGFRRKPIPKVEVEDAELRKLEKHQMSEKMEWLGMLLGYARSKGYKDGWASHKYRAKFGVWPAKKAGVRIKAPNEKVIKWIKHAMIAKVG